MKIEHSQVSLNAHHTKSHLVEERRSLQIEKRDQFSFNRRRRLNEIDTHQLARVARQQQMNHTLNEPDKVDACVCVEEEIPSITGDQNTDAKLIALAIMVSRLTGKSVYVGRVGHDREHRCLC